MRRGLLLLIVMVVPKVAWCAPAGGAETTASRPASVPTAVAEFERVEALLLQLGSRDWNEREEAAATLKRMGPAITGMLSKAYRTATRFEVRLRIREIASELFLTEQFPQKKGFIGIRMGKISPGRDRRLTPTQAAIQVVEVLTGTAAERAGLQAGDLIVALNGKPVPPDQTDRKFAEQVSAMGPGARVELKVIRGKQQGILNVTLGARPLRLENAPRIEEVRQAWEGWWARHFEPGGSTATRPAR